ncbi:uncharacterized protein LOC144923972 [Branchiostoma floridae x Branchiostoma belcheri]
MDNGTLGNVIIHDLWMTSSPAGLGGKFGQSKHADVTVHIIWSLNGRKEKNKLCTTQEEIVSDELCRRKRDIKPATFEGVLRCMEDILSVEEGRRPASFLVGPAGQTVRRLDVWDTPVVSKNIGAIKPRGLSLLKRVVQCFGRRLRKLRKRGQTSVHNRRAGYMDFQSCYNVYVTTMLI